MSKDTKTVAEIVEAEVHRAYTALQNWYGDEAACTSFDTEIAFALNENFEWIRPTGEQTTREKILAWIRSRRGSNPGRQISVEDFRVVAHVGNIAVSKYTAKIIDEPGQKSSVRREATAVLMIEPRLQWLHLFETASVDADGDRGPWHLKNAPMY